MPYPVGLSGFTLQGNNNGGSARNVIGSGNVCFSRNAFRFCPSGTRTKKTLPGREAGVEKRDVYCFSGGKKGGLKSLQLSGPHARSFIESSTLVTVMGQSAPAVGLGTSRSMEKRMSMDR